MDAPICSVVIFPEQSVGLLIWQKVRVDGVGSHDLKKGKSFL